MPVAQLEGLEGLEGEGLSVTCRIKCQNSMPVRACTAV